jgi:hypothetical protein
MYVIELETNINKAGYISLPREYQVFYGHHAKLILLLADSEVKQTVHSSLLAVLSKLDNIDVPFPDIDANLLPLDDIRI